MGGHSSRSCSSPETLPPPALPPHCVVSGEIIPDKTGNYFENGIFQGKMSYILNDYLIRWNAFQGLWTLSSDVPFSPAWKKNGGNVNGIYAPVDGAVGNATIILIP